MLTRMTDADWAQVVEIFRACRSRRGDKGRDDRRFLEGCHERGSRTQNSGGCSGRERRPSR